MKAKSREQKRHLKPRKNMKSFIVAGALTLAGISWSVYNHLFPDFEKAKNNFQLRQNYLSYTIKLKEGYVDGLKKINYDPFRESAKHGDLLSLMRTYFEIPANYSGNDLETRIVVYRGAFERAGNVDEFLSDLIDHEFKHTDQVRGKMKIRFGSRDEYESIVEELGKRAFDVNGDLFRIFLELTAYIHQIEKFSERRNLSEEFKERVISAYNAWVDSLNAKEKSPLIVKMSYAYPHKEP